MFPISLDWIKAAAGAAIIAGIVWYVWDAEHTKAAFATYRAEVRVQGEAAQREAEETAADNKQAQESANAALQALRSRVTTLTRQLHDFRASRGYVPATAPGSGRVDRPCFDRADLDGAIRRLDAGVQGLIDEGDAAIDGLNVSRRWAAAVGEP